MNEQNVSVKEITAKSALNRIKSNSFPFNWDLNIYRGCGHGCKYCYARYSHSYLQASDFTSEIFVKTNIAEQLEKELSSRKLKGELINIGGVTDSYQPLEEEYGLMREVLKVLIKFRNPVVLSTKSDLILRDLDLFRELAEKTRVNIAVTVTTVDEDTRKIIEPFSSPSLNRFEVIKQFATTKVARGVHVMPILPFITDSVENLDEIFALTKKSKADYIFAGILYLRGITREYYLEFIKKQFPEHEQRYGELYGIDKKNMVQYRQNIYSFVGRLINKYKLSGDYTGSSKQQKMKKSAREKKQQPKITSFFTESS